MKTYDNVYMNEDFYWGTEPNSMCKAVVELLGTDLVDKRLIDLGCGEGKDIIYFCQHGVLCTGADISRPGLDKAERWGNREGLSICTVQADLNSFRLSEHYDIVYSSGSLTYVRPDLRNEVFDNYKKHTNPGGIHAFNVFVEKPFIEVAPDWGEDEYFYMSGDLLRYYWDWEIVSFSEIIFDCNSSGIPHRHAMDVMIARKPELHLYTIRPFEPADQPVVRELILGGLGEHFGFIDETKNPDIDDIQEAYSTNGHLFLVAVQDGEIVGTGALQKETPTRGRLVRISVDKDRRRAGIGSSIVQALLEQARIRGYREVCLETNGNWGEVIRFYNTLGFSVENEEEEMVNMVIDWNLRNDVVCKDGCFKPKPQERKGHWTSQMTP